MTAQETKQTLISSLIKQLGTIKMSSKLQLYVHQFIKDCNLHQLQNLQTNMSEFKKFITQK